MYIYISVLFMPQPPPPPKPTIFFNDVWHILYRREGNPFNTTILPSPPAALPPSIAWPPSPLEASNGPVGGPSSLELPQWSKARKFWTNKRVTWIAVAGLIAVVVLGGLLLLVWGYCKGKKTSDGHGVKEYKSPSEKLSQINKSEPTYQTEKGNLIIVYHCSRSCKILCFPSTHLCNWKALCSTVAKEAVTKPADGHGPVSGGMGVSSKLKEDEFLDVTTTRVSSRPKKNQEINMGGVDVKPVSLRRPPLPPPLLPLWKRSV